MKTSEIIQIRRSCRTFNGLKIEKSAVNHLLQEIEATQPLFADVAMPIIKIIDNDNLDGRLGTYGFINGARRFCVMAVGNDLLQQVQAGFVFEQLVLKATEMGIGTCWLGGTFRHTIFSQAMPSDLGQREIMIVSPLGHATPKRRFAERVVRKVVKADRRKPFNQLFSGFSQKLANELANETAKELTNELANSPAIELVNGALCRVMEAVRLSPSSSNSQPWRARYVAGAENVDAVEFSCVTNNRFSAIDMGIAYCHFLMASAEENLAWRIDPSTLSTPLALRFLKS